MQTIIEQYNGEMDATISFRVSWVQDSEQIEYSLQTTRKLCRHGGLSAGM